MDEVLKLRQLLLEAEERNREEQRRREEAEERNREEQRRREEAEERNKELHPQALSQYLEACHSLHLVIRVVTNPSSTTQGDLTNPTGRIFPRRIVPWNDFPERQDAIWDRLSVGNSFSSRLSFPSLTQLAYAKSVLSPISSENGLRDFVRDTVENAVRKLFDAAYNDPRLRSDLGLGGIAFESHTNLGDPGDTISNPMQSMSLEGKGSTGAPNRSKKQHRKARGKGNRADQFCICTDPYGKNVPVVAIEYKPPHKLAQDDIVAGLRLEIEPERDVIHKDGDSYEFACKRLAAAVVTQLFSYMIGKGLQYGYISTGEVFIFLFISAEDPSTVYYSVSIPQLDVMDDDETRLHYTAVSQVFAFILQAVLATKPSQSWHDAASDLKTWDVEVDHRLLQSPTRPPMTKAEQRTKKRVEKKAEGPSYKPQRSKVSLRSPIRTRNRCKPVQLSSGLQDDSDGDRDDPPSPSLHRPSRPAEAISTSTLTPAARPSTRAQESRGKQAEHQSGKRGIEDRPYCTQRCLLGLAKGGAVDATCPNLQDHKSKHIGLSEFVRFARDQLATDRGRDADCAPLYLAGAIGALFKFRLSSHGYTLVVKGTEFMDLGRLENERDIYSRLQPVQGEHVPVCLGMTDLELPYYYNCGVYTHFLFLSWSGLPLYKCLSQMNKANTLNAVKAAYSSLHQLRVLHLDAEPRNILYDERTQKIMIIDFERTKFSDRQPLGFISSNGLTRKRKRVAKKGQSQDLFTQELQGVMMRVSKCIYRQG